MKDCGEGRAPGMPLNQCFSIWLWIRITWTLQLCRLLGTIITRCRERSAGCLKGKLNNSVRVCVFLFRISFLSFMRETGGGEERKTGTPKRGLHGKESYPPLASHRPLAWVDLVVLRDLQTQTRNLLMG